MNALRLVVLLASGVAAFLAAAEWARPAHGDDELVVAVRRADRPAAAASDPAPAEPAAAPASAAGALDLPGRARGIPRTERAQAFEPLSWQPPPPPPAPVALAPAAPPPPPPAPTAPRLPFAFVGVNERPGLPLQAYVSKGEVLLIVAAGEVIDGGTYRVDSVEPAAVVFTYLPLGTRQTLAAPGVTP